MMYEYCVRVAPRDPINLGKLTRFEYDDVSIPLTGTVLFDGECAFIRLSEPNDEIATVRLLQFLIKMFSGACQHLTEEHVEYEKVKLDE